MRQINQILQSFSNLLVLELLVGALLLFLSGKLLRTRCGKILLKILNNLYKMFFSNRNRSNYRQDKLHERMYKIDNYIEEKNAFTVETVMQVIITIVLLLGSFYIILSKQYIDDGSQKWAFGIIGSIVGYWFPKKK